MGDGSANSPFRSGALVDEIAAEASRPPWWRWRPAWRWSAPAWTASPAFHLVLLGFTFLSTVIVGAGMAENYRLRRPAFELDLSTALFHGVCRHPSVLLTGLPFSCTLLGILLTHELGHYLTCRYYGLRATYPYFIPAPTLIGTLGAFIRIRAPIPSRRVLFDVAAAGPIAGFAVTVPALASAILRSRAGSIAAVPGTIIPGHPLALILLTRLLRPGLNPAHLILTPAGCAAWVGLFVTALNLLPISQLDGGHILYAAFERKHRPLAYFFWLALLPLGYFSWAGWFVWAAIIGLIRVSHPPVLFPSQGLNRPRQVLALALVLIFALCFMPNPFSVS